MPLKIYCPSLKVTLIDSLSKRLKFLQQVIDELELENIFPNARVLRMDADTTSTKNAHQKLIEEFFIKKDDIIIIDYKIGELYE